MLLLPAIAIVALVSEYVVFHNGSWVYDDYFNMVLARTLGFGWTWLTTSVFEHWGIGTNITWSVLGHIFPIDYRWGLIGALVGLGAGIWMFARVFALLVRDRAVLAALVCWFAFSILWTSPLQWWTVSLVLFPNVFFDLLCLFAFLRYLDDGRGRWIVIASASVLAGLLFFEKPALMVVYLALIRCLLTDAPLSLRGLLAIFWRERWFWGSCALAVLAWGAAYVAIGGYESGGHVAFESYLSFFWIMWSHAIVPAVFGLALPPGHLDHLKTLGLVAGQVAVLAVVVATIVRARGAIRAWLFLALVVLIQGALVGASRIAQFGIGTGDALRYWVDFSWLLPLALCAAWRGGSLLPVRADASPARTDQKRSSASTYALRTTKRMPPWTAKSLLTVAMVTYAGLALSTAARLEGEWPGQPARVWYDNVNRGFAALAARHVVPVIADGEVAPEIIGSWADPLSRLSRVLPLFSPSVQVDGALAGPLVTVDASGAMHLARIGSPIGQGSLGRLIASRAATISVKTPAGSTCFATGAGAGTIKRRIPAGLMPAPSVPTYLLLTYRASRWIPITLYLDMGHGSWLPDSTVVLEPYRTQALAWLMTNHLRGFLLQVPPHEHLCVSSLAIVPLDPDAAALRG